MPAGSRRRGQSSNKPPVYFEDEPDRRPPANCDSDQYRQSAGFTLQRCRAEGHLKRQRNLSSRASLLVPRFP